MSKFIEIPSEWQIDVEKGLQSSKPFSNYKKQETESSRTPINKYYISSKKSALIF